MSSLKRYQSYAVNEVTRAILGVSPRPAVLECHPGPKCQLACPYCHSKWEDPILANVQPIRIGSGENPSHILKNRYTDADGLLTVEEFRRLFRDFSAWGRDLVFSGGEEPLLHPAILQIISEANEAGFKPHLYSNGLSNLFSQQHLSGWLGKLGSLRISLHSAAGKNGLRRALNHLQSAVTVRTNLGLTVPIHVALLADTFCSEMLEYVLDRVAQIPLDGIELRNLITSLRDSLHRSNIESNHCVSIQVIKARLLAKGIEQGIIDTSLQNPHEKPVSKQCFAIYRTAIIDPYGGVHLCCMRAHLPPSDIACIGSIREKSLLDILENASESLNLVGSATCWSCSKRDLDFNNKVLGLTQNHTL